MWPDTRPVSAAIGVCDMCSDGRIKVRYGGRYWCGICALICVGDSPTRDLFDLNAEPLPKRGVALRGPQAVSV